MDYRNAYYYLFQEVTEMIKSLQQIQKASVEICLQQPVANGIKKEKKSRIPLLLQVDYPVPDIFPI